jgi:two-component system LytT family response regulator
VRFRALVAEDEPLARGMVVALLRQDAEIEDVVDCADAAQARRALRTGHFDIACLDIEMPETSGVDLASEFAHGGPVVIFVTAFGRYATDAFDVNAVDYVLKPFSDERFHSALDRAKQRVRERKLAELAGQLASVSAGMNPPADPHAASYLSWLPCPQGERSVLVSTSDIVWIQAEDYYVLVHAKKGRYMVRVALTSLEERLDPQHFSRVHRTAIVNLHEVAELRDEERLVLEMSDGARVPVSRSRRRDVESVLVPKLRKTPAQGPSRVLAGEKHQKTDSSSVLPKA